MNYLTTLRWAGAVGAASTLLGACQAPSTNTSVAQAAPTTSTYFAPATVGVQTGGVQVIPITTPKGRFNVWTKRIGNNPKIKVLLLSGGPGLTHEYLEAFESFLPQEGIEFIYYDQLGCGNSDNPKDTTLWSLPRYVEEVEQVRQALHLTKDNFYLYGHSWGAVLGTEYALRYQQNLKGLIISDMMMSAAAYNKYSDTLAKQMPSAVLTEVRQLEAKKQFDNPRYMELLLPNYYQQHVCRIPLAQWPEPVNRSLSKLNQSLYVTMQGPSEFGLAGKLAHWDRTRDLSQLTVPVLSIGGKYDTMSPTHMAWIATQVKQGASLICPNGSHLCMYDDQQVYMDGLTAFLKEVDNGSFKAGLKL